MTITRKVISRMQWWTSPASSTKGLHSTALSKSLSQTYAKVWPSLPKLFSEAFPLLLCCSGGCSLELVCCDTYRVRCISVCNFGLTACDQQSWDYRQTRQALGLDTEIHKYTNTQIQKHCYRKYNFLSFLKPIVRL